MRGFDRVSPFPLALLALAPRADGQALNPVLVVPNPWSAVPSLVALPEPDASEERRYVVWGPGSLRPCGAIGGAVWSVHGPDASGSAPGPEDPSGGSFGPVTIRPPWAPRHRVNPPCPELVATASYRPARPGIFFLVLRARCAEHPGVPLRAYAEVHQFRVTFGGPHADDNEVWLYGSFLQAAPGEISIEVTGAPDTVLRNVLVHDQPAAPPGLRREEPGAVRGSPSWHGRGWQGSAETPEFGITPPRVFDVPLCADDEATGDGLVRRRIRLPVRGRWPSLFVRDVELLVKAGGTPELPLWNPLWETGLADVAPATVVGLSEGEYTRTVMTPMAWQVPDAPSREFRAIPLESGPRILGVENPAAGRAREARDVPIAADLRGADPAYETIVRTLREWRVLSSEESRRVRVAAIVRPQDEALLRPDAPGNRLYFRAVSAGPDPGRFVDAETTERDGIPLAAGRVKKGPIRSEDGREWDVLHAEVEFEAGLHPNQYAFAAHPDPDYLRSLAEPPRLASENFWADGWASLTLRREDAPPLPTLRIGLRPGRATYAQGEAKYLIARFFLPAGSDWWLDLDSTFLTVRRGTAEERFPLRYPPRVCTAGGPIHRLVGDRAQWLAVSTATPRGEFPERDEEERCPGPGPYEVKLSGSIFARDTPLHLRFESGWTGLEVLPAAAEDARALEVLRRHDAGREPPRPGWTGDRGILNEILREAPLSSIASVARATLFAWATPATQPNGRQLMHMTIEHVGSRPAEELGPRFLAELAAALDRAVRFRDRGAVETLLAPTVAACREAIEAARAFAAPDGFGCAIQPRSAFPSDQERTRSILGIPPESADWPGAVDRAFETSAREIPEGRGTDLAVWSLLPLPDARGITNAAGAIRTARRFLEER